MNETWTFPQALAALDLEDLLRRIARVRVAVIGDLCLDVYWHADMRKSELSRETPHFPLPISEERFSLGGAANVCANAAALGAQVQAVGVAGDDWRGIVLRRCCQEQGIGTGRLLAVPGRMTNAYCKPLRHGLSNVVYEDPRLDFADSRPLDADTEAALLESLRSLETDVLCVSDQLRGGCITEAVREEIQRLGRAGMQVVVDSRDRIGLYRGVICKPNELEGYCAVHGQMPAAELTVEAAAECALALSERAGRGVFMTLGANGCLHAEGGSVRHVAAAVPPPQIDFVGAGDTVLASLGASLAAGAGPAAAMTMANLCASVTIGKLGVTGTASPGEVRAAAARQREGGI